MKKFMTVDGNYAASTVAYAFSEVAAIFPITPSSPMGENADAWAAKGRKNLFDEIVDVVEMQSEAGAAGAIHGVLSAGALATTFTASQGLLLMIPNMHKIAGELLPTVFHVSARSLACQSLSIFGDHSDVMSTRNTGFALLGSSSVQEAHDLAVVAHLSTLEARVPFLHFFDGFRTSNEIQKIEIIEESIMKELLDMEYVEQFRTYALNPDRPKIKVGAENPDVYFQGRETVNKYYYACPDVVKKYMKLLSEKTGRTYNLFDYFGASDAEKVIVIMGSGAETVRETVDYLTAKGEKVGVVVVRLYRPFSKKDFLETLPETVKKVAVLDRTKEPGAGGEPLYLDVRDTLFGKPITVIGGRYGLSSKEFTPSMVKAVYDHLNGKCFHDFTVGIIDDVTRRSIEIKEEIYTEKPGVHRCKFWGLGSDGTVGANKNAIKIIGDHTDMYAQGYFVYDSKKSGGITISHLRFGKEKIRSTYLINRPNFVALHNPAYIGRYNILEGIEEGGIFLLNSQWPKEEVFNHLTRDMQETIINKKIQFYNINALKIAEEAGLGSRINTVMQTCFFKISGILPEEEAISLLKEYAKKAYEKKGMEIVEKNWKCIDAAVNALEKVEVPESIDEVKESAPVKKLIPDDSPEFVKEVFEKVLRLEGDSIPVSSMPVDGGIMPGTAKLEKRGVSPYVPHWIPENCIQCNRCAFVCPHAAIRAKQIEEKLLENAPETFKTIKSNSKSNKNLMFKIQVYTEDCQGCGNCVDVCLAKEKALKMVPIEEERKAGEIENAIFFDKLPDNVLDGNKETTVKGSQFKVPLLEFSGACAGCGETPYVKLLTQLFGDRMIIANATGCSSIWGGTFPISVYCTTKEGKGPAWANSLFEDNAEYGLGFRLAVDSNRKQLKTNLKKLLELNVNDTLKELINKALTLWDSTTNEAKSNAVELKKALKEELERNNNETVMPVLRKAIELQDYAVDKSVWIIGGDGWAYDIGYGGLDHVIASGRNINILVLDTEVYSNTGGQASKATPYASIAKFAASGKKTGKKNLGLMAISYGNVYVASVAMGANPNQTVKAFTEAEAYPGASIVIAYAPCIAHGINMSLSQREEKLAVESGYWLLYRYNPALALEGKNPLIFESKDPKISIRKFIANEKRYSQLKYINPDEYEKLYTLLEQDMLRNFHYMKALSQLKIEQPEKDKNSSEEAQANT